MDEGKRKKKEKSLTGRHIQTENCRCGPSTQEERDSLSFSCLVVLSCLHHNISQPVMSSESSSNNSVDDVRKGEKAELDEESNDDDEHQSFEEEMDDQDDDDQEDTGDSEDEEDGEETDIVSKAKKFFETEAELSGEEGSSDEDEADELEDGYEDEEGADKEELPDEDVQRDQISKVFQKQQLDEDKRQLLIYQERLFEDGDLHMDGKSRQKKFKWRNVDNNGWLDHIYNSSSDEEGQDGMNDDRDDDDVKFCSQVKINYKKKEEGGHTAASILEETSNDMGINDQQTSSDKQPSTNKCNLNAFGGPAGSILSYVVRDKKTVELLANKSPHLLLKKRNIKKKKLLRRPGLR